LSEALDRLAGLESRVAALKDWKAKYEHEKKRTEKVRDALREFIGFDAMTGLTGTPGEGTKEILQMTAKDLVVNVSHEEKVKNLTTDTVIGKVLFCGLTDLASLDGFSEAQLSVALAERGWNIGHSTLGPTLGGLVRDGYLIRTQGKPMRYRMPTKVLLTVKGGHE
jgi:hypothetical protein